MVVQIISITLDALVLLAFAFTLIKHTQLFKQKESECYTDYTHRNLILRVYKPEFEYEAIGKVSRDKLLDRGTLSKFYVWALIEK